MPFMSIFVGFICPRLSKSECLFIRFYETNFIRYSLEKISDYFYMSKVILDSGKESII